MRPREIRKLLLLPRLWVVERTFCWLNLDTGSVKDTSVSYAPRRPGLGLDLHHRDVPARFSAKTGIFHYTPKHGNWLSIAEIELTVLFNMRLTQCIPDKGHLRREVGANVNTRNAKAALVNWRFTSQEVCRKLVRLSPRFST